MKKTAYFLLALSVSGLVGCGEDYLNIQPETYQTENNFYQTKEQFLQAINAAYSPLQGLHTGQFWALGEMRSDNTSYQYNTGDRSGFPQEELDEFREIANNTFTSGFFNTCYLGIARTNVILDRIGGSSIDQATKDLVTGQASFLRAFYYFQLVRFYGDVPLVLAQVKSTDEAFSATSRKPAADVYTAILADAQAAVAKLPITYPAADKGRVTQGAARMLLAEIYMTQKNFSAATTELRAITGYQLNTNYADNFATAKKNGPESIFEIQYSEGATLGESSNFIYRFAPYNSGSSVIGFAVESGAAAGWNIPTQDMLDAYEAGDLRKAASVGLTFTDPNTGKVVPYIKKYQTAHALRFQTGSNFPVYRYADTKLLLAECLNETGFVPDGEAFTLLNEVRTRAGLPSKSTGAALPALQITSQEQFREAIAHERQVELAFENHRWFDLVRTGKAVEVMQAHGQREKALKSYVNPVAYQNIRLLYPYPQREQELLR